MGECHVTKVKLKHENEMLMYGSETVMPKSHDLCFYTGHKISAMNMFY